MEINPKFTDVDPSVLSVQYGLHQRHAMPASTELSVQLSAHRLSPSQQKIVDTQLHQMPHPLAIKQTSDIVVF